MNFKVYPCDQCGKILNGYTPVVCTSFNEFNSFVFGFSSNNGIKSICVEYPEYGLIFNI